MSNNKKPLSKEQIAFIKKSFNEYNAKKMAEAVFKQIIPTFKLTGQFGKKPKGYDFLVKSGVYATLEVQEDQRGKLMVPLDYQQQLEEQYKGEWDIFEIIAKKGTDGKWFDVSDYGRSDDIIQLRKGFESSHDYYSSKKVEV